MGRGDGMINRLMASGLILVIITCLLAGLPPALSATSPTLMVTPLTSSFNVTPGSSFTIPIKVVNSGNSTVSNVTVTMNSSLAVFWFTRENVSMNLSPGTSRIIRFPVRVSKEARAGRYNVTVEVRAGNFTSRFVARVLVLLIPSYLENVSVGKMYHAGQNVTINFSITSRANGVIGGPVWIRIYRDGKEVYSHLDVVFLNSSSSWRYVYTLRSPPVGNYTVRMVSNLSGRYEVLVKTFHVFRRHFTLRAWFSAGYLHATVKLTNGSPVVGLKVRVGSTSLLTDNNGEVRLRVDKPGVYRVSTELDGVNKTVFVTVESLVLSTSIQDKTLTLTVTSSSGSPVSNATVAVSGPKGSVSGLTNKDGILKVSLKDVGTGILLITVRNPDYIGLRRILNVPSLSSTQESSTVQTTSTSPSSSSSSLGSTSPSTSTPTSTTSSPSITVPATPFPRSSRSICLPLLVGIAIVAFVLAFYLSFMRPYVTEDELRRYYFVKVRAPRLRRLRGFKFKKAMNAVEVRATKGRACIDGNVVTWEIDEMEPNEEAILQVLLG